jgi:hypothetical protein
MDTLRFEGRDLEPYQEYVSASALVEGETYFAVHFLDDQMRAPELRPLVFVGRDREAGDSGLLYFQDAESYVAGVRYDSGSGDGSAEFHAVHHDTPFVSEYEQALESLLRCSLRRRASRT